MSGVYEREREREEKETDNFDMVCYFGSKIGASPITSLKVDHEKRKKWSKEKKVFCPLNALP